MRDEAGWRHSAPGQVWSGRAGESGRWCVWESAWGKRERWEGAKARTAFPQSRPELAPAAAVGGFCGGAPCPDGIQFLVSDLLGPGQSTSLLSAGGGGMSFFAASAQPISSDLPCWRPIPRKVLRFCRGPSMPEADFMEGRRFFRGTFHARGRFHGRSALFHWDLPCQRPFLWKVGALFRGTFDARDNTHERARGERANLAGWRRNPKKRAGEG